MGAREHELLQKGIQMLKTQIAQDLNLSICGPTSLRGNNPEEVPTTSPLSRTSKGKDLITMSRPTGT